MVPATLLLLLLLQGDARPAGPLAADAAFVSRLTPLAGTVPTQWRVVWTADPATEATVSWTTADPGTRHVVHYGPAADTPAGARLPFLQRSDRDGAYTRHSSEPAPPAHYHHVRLTGLLPSTTYRFVLQSDGERSRELHFTTAPADDRPLSLLVGGDSRTGWRARCFLNETIARLAEADDAVLALSHGGDFVTVGERWSEWSKWLSHHELTTTPSGRVLPILPTRGNHDFGPLFDEVFDDPGRAGRNHYRTMLSPEVALLTLNSNISAGGDQRTWLQEQLAETRPRSRWLLVNYHRALYPAVKSPGAAKRFWVPLFEEHDVDLALESDGHCIKRTMPIRDDRPDPTGVVYVGEGGLGVRQRTPRTSPWYLQPPAVATSGHHVLRLDFSAAELRLRILRLPELPPRISPADYRLLVPPGARWRHLGADEAPAGWATVDFDASSWPEAEAGLGFGDDDDRTVLEEMRGSFSRVHLRTTLEGDALAENDSLTLMCRYDDAFVAYLNGVELVRAGISWPAPGKKPRIRSHEALQVEAFPLPGWRRALRPGTNVLAIVGYNRMRSDRDFTLDPWLAGDALEAESRTAPALEVVDDYRLTPRGRR